MRGDKWADREARRLKDSLVVLRYDIPRARTKARQAKLTHERAQAALDRLLARKRKAEAELDELEPGWRR